MTQKRIYSREFKLDLMHQIESRQKRAIEVCREYGLDEGLLSRWHREYRERGETAFLPKEFGEMTPEYLEKKRAWDRNYYQRHKIERQVANYGKRTKLFQYIQQIKAKAVCKYCGENHPATLQFHHRDPSQKEFNIAEFVTRHMGSIVKLQKEIDKCDIVCANCHLKYHYYHRRSKHSRFTVEPIADQFVRLDEEFILSQDEELARTIVKNYFSEEIDIFELTDEFYDGLEQY
jgi:transposase-like protein